MINSIDETAVQLELERKAKDAVAIIFGGALYGVASLYVMGFPVAGAIATVSATFIHWAEDRKLVAFNVIFLLSLAGSIAALMSTGLAYEWDNVLWGNPPNQDMFLRTCTALNVASTVALPAAVLVTAAACGIWSLCERKKDSENNDPSERTSLTA